MGFGRTVEENWRLAGWDCSQKMFVVSELVSMSTLILNLSNVGQSGEIIGETPLGDSFAKEHGAPYYQIHVCFPHPYVPPLC
jgi:hypothetical protein